MAARTIRAGGSHGATGVPNELRKIELMTSQEVLNYVQARPFRPFQIRMNSGRTFDIRHPEMVRVGKRDVLIFTFVSDSPDVYDKWQNVSLVLIESLSPVEAPVA
jgi:hypothetical protein